MTERDAADTAQAQAGQESWSWEMLQEVHQTLRSHFKSGGTIGDLLGFQDEHKETLYSVGRSFYAQGKFKEAFKIFSVLVTNDHMDPRFAMSLGAASQMIGRYEDALTQYMLASALMMGDPRPVFHAAECLIELKRIELAIETLELVESLCDSDEHAEIVAHANDLLQRLKAENQKGEIHV